MQSKDSMMMLLRPLAIIPHSKISRLLMMGMECVALALKSCGHRTILAQTSAPFGEAPYDERRSTSIELFARLKTARWTKIGTQGARFRQRCIRQEELSSGERTQRLLPCLTSGFNSPASACPTNAQMGGDRKARKVPRSRISNDPLTDIGR